MVTIALLVVFLLIASKGFTFGWALYLVGMVILATVLLRIHLYFANKNLHSQ